MFRCKGRIYTNLNEIPPREYAIVFGARVYQDGSLSDVARERAEAAISLYRQGKVRKLFISGDNRHNHEVETIARYAIDHGIPEADLIMDHLGIDTNDTCRHFKSVHHEAVLITQSFHLPRALFMCEQSQIQGIGLAANELGLLASRGDNSVEVYGIRLSRFLRESLLTWLYITGLYDHLSNEAEMIEKGIKRADLGCIDSRLPPNNSFNPSALSLPFIMLVRLNRALLLASGSGLIRALGRFACERN